MHIVDRRACARCELSQARERARARKERARAAHVTHTLGVAQRRERAHVVPPLPRSAGNAHSAVCNRNDRRGNDRRRMGVLAKARDNFRQPNAVSLVGDDWQ